MKPKINYIGKIVALGSFIIGTTLLSFYLYFGEKTVSIEVAFFFVLSLFIINSVIFSTVILRLLIYKTHIKESLQTLAIMLTNIPICVLYVYMVFTFPGHKLL